MTQRMRRLAFVLAFALYASGMLAACGLLGGQTGQESKDSNETPCNEGNSPIDDDDSYAIGASPREVVDALRGPLRAPLNWTKLQTHTQITIELNYAGGAAQVAYRWDCFRRLELDVTLAIKTGDGLLDEHLPATLWVTASDAATLEVTIALAKLNGTYDASEVDDATADAAIRIAVEWTAGTTHGSVDVTSKRALGDAAATAPHETVATW